MNVDKVYILEDRGVLYINGDDCTEFLQNLITNDLNKVSENNSCFASLLTPQGKYLFDFIIAKHKEGYFIDCEKKVIDELFNKLNLYDCSLIFPTSTVSSGRRPLISKIKGFDVRVEATYPINAPP